MTNMMTHSALECMSVSASADVPTTCVLPTTTMSKATRSGSKTVFVYVSLEPDTDKELFSIA